MFLKFPPILAGNGSFSSYVVLAVIVAVVIGVLWFVFSRLDRDTIE